MKVTVRWFAKFREHTGKNGESVEIPEGASVEELVERLEGIYPNLSVREESVGVAVNRKYVGRAYRLNDGDELAFIPPVGGG